MFFEIHAFSLKSKFVFLYRYAVLLIRIICFGEIKKIKSQKSNT